MASGASWRSPSIRSTASPSAARRPAANAAWWPKFRAKWIDLIRLSSCASPRRMRGVPSVLPSLTKMISRSTSSATTCRMRRTSSGIVGSSLRTGITTESFMRGSSRVAGEPRGPIHRAAPPLPDHPAEHAVAAAEVLLDVYGGLDCPEHAPELPRTHVELRRGPVRQALDLRRTVAWHEAERRHLEGQVPAPILDPVRLVLGLPDRGPRERHHGEKHGHRGLELLGELDRLADGLRCVRRVPHDEGGHGAHAGVVARLDRLLDGLERTALLDRLEDVGVSALHAEVHDAAPGLVHEPGEVRP